MSQFLFRVPKLPSRNYALQMQRFRLFSSSVTLHSTPDSTVKRYCAPYSVSGQAKNGGLIYFDSLCDYTAPKKKVPCEWLEAMGTVGASQGWVATLKKRVLSLHDDMNISASVSNPKHISLPPLVTLPRCQTQIVASVAMSSSSPEEDDCVVAVKFLGPQLSLCRPAQDSEWTNIRITDPSFFTSPVMFSQRDQIFSMLASGGSHIGSWDLNKHRDKPKLQKLHFQNLPRLNKRERELLDSPYKTEHLVESSDGETFLVIWYRCRTEDMSKFETKGFRVFRLDGEGNAFYTRDLGDVCIFISKSEPFCAPLSCLGEDYQKRNLIRYVDFHVHWYRESRTRIERGVFGIRDTTWNYTADGTTKVPYYFPPQPI